MLLCRHIWKSPCKKSKFILFLRSNYNHNHSNETKKLKTARVKVPHSHLHHIRHVVHGQQLRNSTMVAWGHQSQEALPASAMVDAAAPALQISDGVVVLHCGKQRIFPLLLLPSLFCHLNAWIGVKIAPPVTLSADYIDCNYIVIQWVIWIRGLGFSQNLQPGAGGRGTVPGPKGQLRTGKSSSAGILRQKPTITLLFFSFCTDWLPLLHGTQNAKGRTVMPGPGRKGTKMLEAH